MIPVYRYEKVLVNMISQIMEDKQSGTFMRQQACSFICERREKLYGDREKKLLAFRLRCHYNGQKRKRCRIVRGI